MPAADDDTVLPFSLPNIRKKKVTAAFDGGTISSDGGVFLLASNAWQIWTENAAPRATDHRDSIYSEITPKCILNVAPGRR